MSLNLSEKHYIAIAKVAMNSALLDYHLEHTIDAALGDRQKTSAFVLKNLGADRLVSLLGNILHDMFPADEATIDSLIGAITHVRNQRNNLLHWTWMQGLTPETAMASSSRPHREFKYQEWTVPEIDEISGRLAEVAMALLNWQDVIHRRGHSP